MSAIRYLVDVLFVALATIVLTVVLLAYNSPDTLGKVACDVTSRNANENSACLASITP